MTEPWQHAQHVVDEMRERLARLSESSAGGEGQDGPVGRGEALSGRLSVTISNGRVSEVALDPRALRTPSDELADAFAAATNDALGRYQEALVGDDAGAASLPELARMLDQVSSDAQRALDAAGQGVQDSLWQVRRASELHRRTS